MKYDVTLASYALTNNHAASRIPVPDTETTVVLDTGSGLGRDIWWGYLQMRTEGNSIIQLTSAASEQAKFEEAINIFHRFLADNGRDNCRQVARISVHP